VATVALRRPGALGTRSIGGVRILEAAGLVALVALSLALRTTQMGTHFWIDEGLSVGIGSHALTDIPGLLRQDGSPPLYYMVLHVWMQIAGDGVVATHWLSLIFALLCIPVAFWAGSTLFDRRVAWTFAFLMALNPFLTSYAQETRMYSLVVLLAIPCVTSFLLAYVYGRRGWRIPFGVLLALLLWTHNWAMFLGAAFVLSFVVVLVAAAREDRRALLRDGLVGFGTTAVLYAAWIPTLLFQAAHTGAPWAQAPSARTLLRAPDMLLGGQAGSIIVLLIGGFGLAALAGRSLRDRRVLVPVVVILGVSPILFAWIASQISPAWATRYLAIALAPLLLMVALGMRRAGALGVAALAVLTILWVSDGAPSSKSNAHYVAKTEMGPRLKQGDVVISTQPEQVPVLSYYLPDKDLRYFTPFGPVQDTGIVDWRDGAEHFDRTGVNTQLMPLLDEVPIGSQVLLVRPIISRPDRWEAPWTSRVRDRSIEYEGVMRGDPRFELTAIVPQWFGSSPGPNPLQGLLFRKVRNS